MRSFLLASTALLCTFAFGANAETAAERLKSRLEQARYEAAGLTPPPSDQLVTPSAKPVPLKPIDAAPVSNERIPLAAISSDKEKDDLLNDSPRREAVAQVKEAAPVVKPTPVKNWAPLVTPPAKPIVTRTPPPPTEIKTTTLPLRESRDLPALHTPQTAKAAPSSIRGLLFDNGDMPTFAPPAPVVAKAAPVKAAVPEFAPVVANTPVVTAPVNAPPAVMPAPKVLPPVVQQAAPAPAPVVMPPVTVAKAGPTPAPARSSSEAVAQTNVMRPVQTKPNQQLANAAHRVGAWKIRTLEGKDKQSAFCLMEAAFDNDMMLLIGQRADGYSTLGVNYGLDMLQAQRPYKITVTLDNSFAEDFLGYAESGRMAIAQMGRKPSFFMELTRAQVLTVSMPGVATMFDMSGTMEQLPQFEQCLNSIGAAPLQQVTAQQEPSVPVIDNAPVQASEIVPTPPVVAVAAPAPMPAPAPIVTAPVVTPPAPAQKVAELQWDKPVETKQVEVKPVAPMKLDEPLVALPAKTNWVQQAQGLLRDANVRTQSFTPAGDTALWRDQSGMVTGHVTATKDRDVIDAAQNALDAAEKKCNGAFDSQMGIPENYGAENMRVQAQSMESKCANGGQVTVSSWLVTQQGDSAMTWEMQANRDQRNAAFTARDQMLAVVKAKGR